MDITPLIKQGQQVIQSYAGGKFRVSGRVYETPVIVFPDRTAVWDAPDNPSDLTILHFDALLADPDTADVVLLGTGAGFVFLPQLLKELKIKGLHAEVMDTGAACRTYNVLMAEGRRIACALLKAQ